jgi:hypothetical protein
MVVIFCSFTLGINIAVKLSGGRLSTVLEFFFTTDYELIGKLICNVSYHLSEGGTSFRFY